MDVDKKEAKCTYAIAILCYVFNLLTEHIHICAAKPDASKKKRKRSETQQQKRSHYTHTHTPTSTVSGTVTQVWLDIYVLCCKHLRTCVCVCVCWTTTCVLLSMSELWSFVCLYCNQCLMCVPAIVLPICGIVSRGFLWVASMRCSGMNVLLWSVCPAVLCFSFLYCFAEVRVVSWDDVWWCCAVVLFAGRGMYYVTLTYAPHTPRTLESNEGLLTLGLFFFHR